MSAPISERSDREAMLRDPVLKAALVRLLRKHMPLADVDPFTWATLHAAYEAQNLPPPGDDRTSYVLAIGRKKAIDHARKGQRQPRIDENADVEQCVATAADPVGDRDLLVKMARGVAPGNAATFGWLARHLLGESVGEIAREAGVDYDVVYKRVMTMKKRALAAALSLVAVAFAVVLTSAMRKPKLPTALPDTPAPTVEPATSTEKPDPIALERARELREKAFAACMKNQWDACESGLNEARELDPPGDDDPRVEAAVSDIQIGTSLMPGSRWKPTEPRLYDPKR